MCVPDSRSFNVSDVANDNARRVWNRSRGRETIEVTLIRAFSGHRQGSFLAQPGVGGSGRRVTENRTLIVCGLGVVVCYLWVIVAPSSELSFIFQSCKMIQKVFWYLVTCVFVPGLNLLYLWQKDLDHKQFIAEVYNCSEQQKYFAAILIHRKHVYLLLE